MDSKTMVIHIDIDIDIAYIFLFYRNEDIKIIIRRFELNKIEGYRVQNVLLDNYSIKQCINN